MATLILKYGCQKWFFTCLSGKLKPWLFSAKNNRFNFSQNVTAIALEENICLRVVLWRNRGFPFTKRENWKHRAKSCTERLRRPKSEVPSVKLSGSERSYCHQRGLLRWLRLACHACCSSHYWLWNWCCGVFICVCISDNDISKESITLSGLLQLL